MNQIVSLTNNPRQSFYVPIDGGDIAQFKLYYYASQKSWFFDLSYGNLKTNGNRVVLTPNALRNLKNIIPFGIAFITDGDVEPFDIEDFASGRVGMYVLTHDEVLEIESTIYGV